MPLPLVAAKGLLAASSVARAGVLASSATTSTLGRVIYQAYNISSYVPQSLIQPSKDAKRQRMPNREAFESPRGRWYYKSGAEHFRVVGNALVPCTYEVYFVARHKAKRIYVGVPAVAPATDSASASRGGGRGKTKR